MDMKRNNMDVRKIGARCALALKPTAVQPAVHYANYQRVPPAQTWGPRTIPDLELILVVEGRFEYAEAGRAPFLARMGEVIAIPPHVTHTVGVTEGCLHARFSCIHAELLPDRTWGAGQYQPDPLPPPVTDTRMDPVLHDLFQRCAVEFERFHPYREPLLRGIVREIWLRLAGYWQRPEGRRPTRRTAAMVDFVRANLQRPLSRRDLARHAHLTPEHINALFRLELGTTPGAFIQRERVRLAYRLLSDEGLSVKETAERTGFADPFHFSRVFKRLTGQPPSRLRGR